MYRRIQSDFESVIEWTLRNNLRLNVDKTKAIVFGSRHSLSKLKNLKPFIMNGKNVKYVQHHPYLGVVLDGMMSLVPQMKAVKKRLNNKVFMLKEIRKYLSFEAAVIVYICRLFCL